MSAPLETCVRAQQLSLSVYERNCAGCCLHVLLDDHNVGDDTAAFCLQWAKDQLAAEGEEHRECVELAGLVVAMSRTQRLKLVHNGYRKLLEAK